MVFGCRYLGIMNDQIFFMEIGRHFGLNILEKDNF